MQQQASYPPPARPRADEITPAPSRWRRELYHVIFEHDTFVGKSFDVVLMIAIGLSVLVVMLDSVPTIHARHGTLLLAAEWFFTILFTIDCGFLWCALRRDTRGAFTASSTCSRSCRRTSASSSPARRS